jgi:hypothetical protein
MWRCTRPLPFVPEEWAPEQNCSQKPSETGTKEGKWKHVNRFDRAKVETGDATDRRGFNLSLGRVSAGHSSFKIPMMAGGRLRAGDAITAGV